MADAEPPVPTTVRITLIDATTDKRTSKISYVRQRSTITFEWLQAAATRQFEGRYAPGRIVRLYHGIEQEDGTLLAHRLDDNADVQQMLDNPSRTVLVSFMRPGNLQLLLEAPRVTDVRNLRQAPEEPKEPKKSPPETRKPPPEPKDIDNSDWTVIIEKIPKYEDVVLKHMELNKPPTGKRKAEGAPGEASEIEQNDENCGGTDQEHGQKKKSPDPEPEVD